jgi:hypothetical protein
MRSGHTAKRFETIRKSNDERHEVQVETPIQKIERAQRHAAALEDAIAAYAKANGCSRARAMDAVLAHPTTSEYHRLDKALMAAEREAAALSKLEGTADISPVNRTKPAKTPPVVKPSEAGPVWDDAPAATRPSGAMTADEVLQRLADLQQTKAPGMSRARAVMVAANSQEFARAHKLEKMAKGL